MSLVYDALKQQADPAQPARVPPRASWWARQPARHRGVLLLTVGAVVAAPLVLLAASALDRPAPDAMGVAAAPLVSVEGPQDIVAVDAAVHAVASPANASAAMSPDTPDVAQGAAHEAVAAVTPTAPATSALLETPALGAAAAPAAIAGAGPTTATGAGDAVAAMALPMHAATPEVAASAPTPASAPPTTAPEAASPINITVAQRASSRGGPGSDEAAIAQAVRAIESAVAAGDTATAHAALADLEAVLHADSLTLLRMQAWVAHGSQDMAGAEQLYRRIAERLPDDLNAGVNIALLDARRGEVASARGRLQRLAGRHGRSRMLAQAIAELDGYAQ